MSSGSRKTNWAHGRSAHRQRSHEEAHAGADAAPSPPILKHALVPGGPAAIIADQSALDAHMENLRDAGGFAFDTEFIGEHTYHAKVCLVQTATSDAVTIIDPLTSALDLRGLWELLADERVRKIVHAGEQDIEPVLRHTGRPPANVVDTQVIAAFAGWGYPTGMFRMIRELLGADPGHGLTFSQWDRRPLSRVQTLYAATDVRYLLLLHDTLARLAQDRGNLAWAMEECGLRCATERFVFDADNQSQRVRGAESLSARELATLAALLAWRDRAAQEADIPPRALVRDGILMDMTRNTPRSIADLDRVSGLPRPVESRWGAEIVAAAARNPAADDARTPSYDRWANRDTVDALWEVAAQACRGREIDPAIATSKREIGQFVRDTHAGVDLDRAAGRLLRGWRGELLGGVFRGHSAV